MFPPPQPFPLLVKCFRYSGDVLSVVRAGVGERMKEMVSKYPPRLVPSKFCVCSNPPECILV